MKISFKPVRLDEELVMDREGDVLYINGEIFDFSSLPDGATLPSGSVLSEWFPGPVSKIDNELHLTIRLPHGPNAPESTRFPKDILVKGDGPVDIPEYDQVELIKENEEEYASEY